MRSAGGKRTPVQLQHTTQTQSSTGEVTNTWATFATVLADVRSLKGSSFYGQQQDQAVTEAEIVIHFRDDVLSSDRVLIGADAYELTAPPIDVDYLHRETLLRVRRAT